MADRDAGPKLLRLGEVMAELHCSAKTIQRLCRAGELPYLAGRPLRFTADEVKKYKDAQIRRELDYDPRVKRKRRFTQDATPEQVEQAQAARRARGVRRTLLKWRISREQARKREQDRAAEAGRAGSEPRRSPAPTKGRKGGAAGQKASAGE